MSDKIFISFSLSLRDWYEKVRMRERENGYEMVSSGHLSDNGVMISQHLWLPALVMHNTGPVTVNHRSERSSQGANHFLCWLLVDLTKLSLSSVVSPLRRPPSSNG